MKKCLWHLLLLLESRGLTHNPRSSGQSLVKGLNAKWHQQAAEKKLPIHSRVCYEEVCEERTSSRARYSVTYRRRRGCGRIIRCARSGLWWTRCWPEGTGSEIAESAATPVCGTSRDSGSGSMFG